MAPCRLAPIGSCANGPDGITRSYWRIGNERVLAFRLNGFREPMWMTKTDFPYEFVDVVRVRPAGDNRLQIAFSNGDEGERDFSGLIAEGGVMVEPLRDPAFFVRVFIDDGVLSWPNGFDVDSIALHDAMKKAGELRRSAA